MNRKRKIKIITSLVVLAVCVSACVIGVWNAKKIYSDDARTEQSQGKDKSNQSHIKGTDEQNSQKKPSNADDDKDNFWTVWTTDTVRLREKPSGESEVLTTIPQNTELTAYKESDGWLKVTYDKKGGYVNKEFITTREPSPEQENQGHQSAETTQPQMAAGVQGPRPSTGGHIICIDPGHQSSGDSTPEPNGPGSATTKARVTGGTSGRTTGVAEYQLNLAIALQLQQELQARGYTVYMTRTSHDVNISNKERAEYATSVGAEITVRLHANGSENTAVSGALALAPSTGNPYVSHLASASQSLSQCVLNAYCAATGMNNQGVQANDTMTGINWCTMPVTILEMGYMTNPTDDVNMQDAGYQYNMVQGIANGIDQYFGW